MLWLVLMDTPSAHVAETKGKGKHPCVENKDTTDCKLCNSLTPEQRAQLVTPSYKIEKEKCEAKKLETDTPSQDTALVDPSTVSVLGGCERN